MATADAYWRLGQGIERLGTNLGNMGLAGREHELKMKMLDVQLPALKLAANEARVKQQEFDENQKPFNVSRLFGGIATNKEAIRNSITGIEAVTGTKVLEDGTMQNSDGSFVTIGEAKREANQRLYAGAIMANVDFTKQLEHEATLDRGLDVDINAMDNMGLQGWNKQNEEKLAKAQRAKALLKNPLALDMEYLKQLQANRPFAETNPYLSKMMDTKIAEVQKRIEKLEKPEEFRVQEQTKSDILKQRQLELEDTRSEIDMKNFYEKQDREFLDWEKKNNISANVSKELMNYRDEIRKAGSEDRLNEYRDKKEIDLKYATDDRKPIFERQLKMIDEEFKMRDEIRKEDSQIRKEFRTEGYKTAAEERSEQIQISKETRALFTKMEAEMRDATEWDRRKKYEEINKKRAVGNIEADVLVKWMEGGELSKQEQDIINLRFKGKKESPTDAKAKVIARYEGRVTFLENKLGRPLSSEETRRLVINDPWGILAPEEKESSQNILTEEAIKFNMEKYGKTRQQVIDKYNEIAKAK